MLKQCQDSYHSTFGTYEDMLDYHEEQVKASQWQRCQVNTLQCQRRIKNARKCRGNNVG